MFGRPMPIPRNRNRNRAVAAIMLALAIGALALGSDGVGASSEPLKPPPAASAARGPVAGETYLWKPVAIGAGGYITGLSSDDRGVSRVARTDVHGAYIWAPAANRWQQLVTAASMPEADQRQNGMNEGVYEIAVAPSDGNRIYMVIKGFVYRSVDRGAHWARPAEQPPFPVALNANGEFRRYGPFMAVSPRNPDLVLFGTPAAGLWRSADGGVHWSRVASVPSSTDKRPAPGVQAPGNLIWFERGAGRTPTGRIWVMSPGNGMYVSSDNGVTFSAQTTDGGERPMSLARGAFAPDGTFFGVDPAGKEVWRYRGGRWSTMTEAAALSPRAFAAVAITPDGAIYVFDEGGRTFRSNNGGDSWWPLKRSSSAGDGDPPWLRVSNQGYFATADVEPDPVDPKRLWVAAGTGVYTASVAPSDFSLQWVSQSRGIEELVATDVVQPPGGAPLFAALDFGVRVRDDLDHFSTGYGPRERVLIAVQQVDWSPADPHFLVTNASDTRLHCCAEDGQSVLAGFSQDGGQSWTRFATLPQPPGTSPGDPWRMSFGTIAVSANDTKNIVWEPSFNRSPFYTMDRGVTWNRVVLAGEKLPFTGSHQSYFLPRKTLAADRVLPGVFYLVHSGEGANAALTGVWRTADGGAHWQRVYTGEIAPMSRFAAKLRAVPGKAGHLFFTSGVGDAPDTVLRRSTDGGAHWSRVDGVDHVDDVAFGRAARAGAYPTIFISGKVHGVYGIWRSVDDAASWQRVAGFPLGRLDQVTAMDADKDVFGRVYIGYMGSGWLYGEPAPCTIAPFRAGADSDCARVE